MLGGRRAAGVARGVHAAGEADAILSDRIGLTSWLLDRSHPGRCTNFTFASGVNIPFGNPRQIFLALNRTYGFPFFSNVQVALGWLRQKAPAHVLAAIYERELQFGQGCADLGSDASDRIGIQSQLGVFVIFGVFVLLAVIAVVEMAATISLHLKSRSCLPRQSLDLPGLPSKSRLALPGKASRDLLRASLDLLSHASRDFAFEVKSYL